MVRTSRKLWLVGVGMALMLGAAGTAWGQDSDGDGVIDPCDLCAGTGGGMAVDETGCDLIKRFLMLSDEPLAPLLVNHSTDYSPEEYDINVRLSSPGGDRSYAHTYISMGAVTVAEGRHYVDGTVQLWDNADVAYWQGVHDALDPCDPCDLCPFGDKGIITSNEYDYLHPTEPCSIIVDGSSDPTFNGAKITVMLAEDNDGDGVWNPYDSCPATPPGTQINYEGCPDGDGDGVRDACDLCPVTDPKWEVTEEGCADRDEDGVSDYRDACPGSNPAYPVNEIGCRSRRWLRVQCPDFPGGWVFYPSGSQVSVGANSVIEFFPGGWNELRFYVAGPPAADGSVWFRAYDSGPIELWSEGHVKQYAPPETNPLEYDLLGYPTDTGSTTTYDMDESQFDGLTVTVSHVADTDGDGVTDDVDNCVTTPELGAPLDPCSLGCPAADADGDGVADDHWAATYYDLCPGSDPCLPVDVHGCLDTDNDGVPDTDDDCAASPLGATVDLDGCADADGDGVYVPYDECDATPGGNPVNSEGCTDTDGDGVPDTDDICNDPCSWVDENGCPDMDLDGVADASDSCPQTEPVGSRVCPDGCVDANDADADGVWDCDGDICPGSDPCYPVDVNGCQDMDGDGVEDGNDICAGTVAGRVVDVKGCDKKPFLVETEGPLWQALIFNPDVGYHQYYSQIHSPWTVDMQVEEPGDPRYDGHWLNFGPWNGINEYLAHCRLYTTGLSELWDEHDVEYWRLQHIRPGGCPLTGVRTGPGAARYDYSPCPHPTVTTLMEVPEGSPPSYPNPFTIFAIADEDVDGDGVRDAIDECLDSNLLEHDVDETGCPAWPRCDDRFRPSPIADIDTDCYVDEKDLILMAEQWLTCVHPLDEGCIQLQPSPEEMYPDLMYMTYCGSGGREVDGLLGDWPDPCWVALDQIYAGDPNDMLGARYTVCWDPCEDIFYAAIEVEDTDHVFEIAPTNWHTSDRAEIYVQADPNGGNQWGSEQSDSYDKAQQYIVGYQNIIPGWTWAVFGNGTYIPGAIEPGDAKFEDAGRKSGNILTYEIEAKAWIWYGGRTVPIVPNEVRQLGPGMQVGFDVVADSRWGSLPHDDNEEFGVLSANLKTSKYIFAEMFQRWELLDYDGSVVPPECGDWGYLSADINATPDCYLDMGDFEEMSSQWMDCTDPCAPCGFIP